MAFELDNIVPWGRSYEEYVGMFSLSDQDLAGRILGCGDGPASFNATLTRQRGRVVSVDPIYQFPRQAIRARITAIAPTMLEQTVKNQHEFVWKRFSSPEHLVATRLSVMDDFLADYDDGLRQGRYRCESLPKLSFEDHEFDLALCSHFLFLYSPHLDAQFHVNSIQELCRIAKEVRIFPLLELGSRPSRHLETVVQTLRTEGYDVSQEAVDYEFQKTGNKMLRVKSRRLT